MKEIFLILFLIMGAVIALTDYQTHCRIFGKFSSKKCPPHICFLMLSGGCFAAFVALAQKKYFLDLFKYITGAAESSGRIVYAGGSIVKKAASNFESLSDFADTVETMADNV